MDIKGGGAAPRRWYVVTMSDRERGLVESSSGASNILLGTPRDIPRWCTVTSHLVREGEDYIRDGFGLSMVHVPSPTACKLHQPHMT